jgi:preprotein translocase subunit SecA
MLKGLLTKVMGDPNEKELSRLQPLVDAINGLEPEFERLSDAELRAKTDAFRSRLSEGETPDDLLMEAFATVREAAKRTIGLRHYDVQLIGGIVLHQGKIAEMKTGEGKTLVATLPLYLNALEGKGAHLVTPNDYLSKVGVQWMGPIYHLLGLTVAVIQSAAAHPDRGSFVFDPNYVSNDERYQHLRPVSRREAYQAHITYGTNNEFGFDYLRDNMKWDLSELVQRSLQYAIVDEVDNILIDEARTPLIISGPADEPSENYMRFAEIVRRLRPSKSPEGEEPDGDYVVDEKSRVVTLSEAGIEKVERALNIDNLYSPEHFDLTPYLDNALRARVLYKRDRNYIVDDKGEVIIVDEFTGRLMHGRRYSEGLHQAIEAKEGVPVQRESFTYATITFQNFFRMYEKLAGMTGTAATEAEEFHKIYKLDVVIIPTHEPVIRQDHPDVVFTTERAKWNSVLEEIKELQQIGQPVLVGTVAIETSEYLSRLLKKHNVPHQVLNAKQHEREATVIAQAGHSDSVTIATNMAGRGVDILLGGNPEGMARETLRQQGVELTEATPEQWERALAEAQSQCAQDREKVLSLGGLHILGTERHEARRIDNQLRGRAGRQGDPGSSRFYLSLEDDLMRRFGGERVKSLMSRVGLDEDLPIEHGLLSKTIEQAQTRVEGYNFDIRKHVLEYDDVVNKQREVIYDQRRQILEADDLRDVALRMAEERFQEMVAAYTTGLGYDDEWDIAGLHTTLRNFFPLPPDFEPGNWEKKSPDEIVTQLVEMANQALDNIAQQLGHGLWRQMIQEGTTLEGLSQSPSPFHRLLYNQIALKLDGNLTSDVAAQRLDRLAREPRLLAEQGVVEAVDLYRVRDLMLRTVDNLWVRHLTDLDVLREGIGLRAYGQQNPLVAFKKEAHEMYQGLLGGVQETIVNNLFHMPATAAPAVERPRPQRQLVTNVQDGGDGRRRPVKTTAKERLGRNDPCWCGSGKKYKHCHWRQDQTGRTAAQSATRKAGRARPKKARRRKRRS